MVTVLRCQSLGSHCWNVDQFLLYLLCSLIPGPFVTVFGKSYSLLPALELTLPVGLPPCLFLRLRSCLRGTHRPLSSEIRLHGRCIFWDPIYLKISLASFLEWQDREFLVGNQLCLYFEGIDALSSCSSVAVEKLKAVLLPNSLRWSYSFSLAVCKNFSFPQCFEVSQCCAEVETNFLLLFWVLSGSL